MKQRNGGQIINYIFINLFIRRRRISATEGICNSQRESNLNKIQTENVVLILDVKFLYHWHLIFKDGTGATCLYSYRRLFSFIGAVAQENNILRTKSLS